MYKCENEAKEKIFISAAKLFAEKGYDTVSMREISEKAGLSKPTIYYYFGSKEGIYSALIRTSVNHLMNVVDGEAIKELSVKEKLLNVAKAYFRSAKEYPEFTKFMVDLSISTNKAKFFSQIKQHFSEKNEFATELFQEGIDKGEFKTTVNPDVAAKMFSGTLIHYILHYLAGDELDIDNNLADAIVDTLVGGLAR